MCGCGTNAGTIASSAQAQAASGTTIPPGFVITVPLVIGEEVDGDSVRRVRAMTAGAPVAQGASAYVAGDGVDELIETGAFVDITEVQQQGRVFQAGPKTYLDKTTCQRVAAALGTKCIEVA